MDRNNNMTSEELLRTMQTLFGLHKATSDSITASQIVGHPNFMFLCRKIRIFAPAMSVTENLNVLKIINYLKIPANSELSLILLNLIRRQINDMSLQEMIFADFLLSQLTPELEIVKAMKAALPLLFESQLEIQMDTDDAPELIALLKFATNKSISPHSVGMIVNPLTRLLNTKENKKALNNI